MNEFKIFIGKLKSLNVIGVDDKTILCMNGFSITYSFQMNQSNVMLPNVQIVLHVWYKGEVVSFWGCTNVEEQSEVVDFIFRSEHIANLIESTNKGILKREGKAEFSKL